MTEKGTATPEPAAAARATGSWTIERTLGVLNLSLIIVAAVLATIGWFPKWGVDRLAFAARLQTPTVPSADLKVSDLGDLGDGSHCYEVDYNVSTKNLSDRSVKITYAISQLFVGERTTVPLQIHQAYEINDPPNPWDPSGVGQIKWHQVAYDASEIDGGVPKEVQQFFDEKHYQNLSPGGGMTGILSPGDTTGEDPNFVIRARPAEYIGTVVSYGIDNATKSPNAKINLTSDHKHLAEVNPPKEDKQTARDHCGLVNPK